MTQELPSRRSAWLLLGLVWGAAIVYVLTVAVFGGSLFADEPAPRAELIKEVVFLICWAVATPGILWSARGFPVTPPHRARHLAVHLVLAAAFIFGLNLFGVVVSGLLGQNQLDPATLLSLGLREFLQVFHLALIPYAFIVGVGHYLQVLEARRTELLRAERLRADLAEAQLRALRLQLQPHFLFNALNAIGSLILTGRSTEAFEAVGQLGELLRSVLATEHRQEVTLREEVEMLAAYLAIEGARLGERLRVAWEIAPDVGAAQLPPMLLQPLVENAIQHGIARQPGGGQLRVRAVRVGDRLQLEVADTGPGPQIGGAASEGRGVGLENARQRLAHLYGEDQRLTLERRGEWTRVLVELPFHRTEAIGSEVLA